MFYEIIGIEMKTEKDDKGLMLIPVAVTVQIGMQDSNTVETYVVQLNHSDIRQFENLLRHRVDKALNGE